MNTEELLTQLRSLPPGELRQVLSQIGCVPEVARPLGSERMDNDSEKGMTLGLLRGTFTQIADDFDSELSASFWAGEKEAS